MGNHTKTATVIFTEDFSVHKKDAKFTTSVSLATEIVRAGVAKYYVEAVKEKPVETKSKHLKNKK